MRLVQSVLLMLVMLTSVNVHAFEWRNLWSTPEQRAAKNLEDGDFDTLVEEAPNAAWQGVGEYRKGDYEAASESFAKQHEQAVSAGSTPDAVSAQYNRANAEVLAGNYEQALNLYDEVLELNPEHEDAKHNAEIAQQLWKQQEQQQQSGDDQGESDEGESQDGEQQQSGSNGQQQDSPQNNQQQDSEPSNQSQDQQQNGGQQESQQMEQNSAEAQQAEDQKAKEAMQAERDADQNANQNAQIDDSNGPLGNEPTNSKTNGQLTEQEQATEQWLRQIPDDPAGLLQRKLQNRHMTDYPEVQNSAKPW